MNNNQTIAEAKTGSKAAMLQLYEQNRRLIYKCVSGYAGARYPIDDLMQEAYFAMVKAIEAYDQDSGLQFSTYLVNALKWYFTRYVRQDKNRLDYCILDAPINPAEADGATRGEMLEDEAAAFEEKALHSADMFGALEMAKKVLSKRKEPCFDVLYWRYACNASYAKIAELLGCSEKEVKKIQAIALQILRHPMNRERCKMRYDAIGASYHHSTLTEFKNTHTSSVEWAAERL